MMLDCMFAGTEADWVRRVGVLIAIAGTAVAAPDGTARAWRNVKEGSRRVGRKAHAAMARLLPWFRKEANIPGVTLNGGVRFPAPSIQATGHVWYPDADVEAKVQLLHQQMDRAYEEIARVEREARTRDAELTRLIEDRVSELKAAARELRQLFDVREERAVRVDARAVILIGLGVVMTGVPDGLARLRWIGLLFMTGAVALTAEFVRQVISDTKKAR